MPRKTRGTLITLWASALALGGLAASAIPAQAVPNRFSDRGTVLMCDGEQGSVYVTDTTQATSWYVGVSVDGVDAMAFGETGLLVGDALAWTGPVHDPDTGTEVGQLTVTGSIVRGEAEVLSGWDVNPDGFRYATKGTRTALSGSVTLSLRGGSTTLDCSGWDIDTETLELNRRPAGDRSEGWWSEVQSLGADAGSISFYGDRETELGIAIDLAEPYAFAGERLQVRNGSVDGSILLRDPETWAIVGMLEVAGTVRQVGTGQDVEISDGFRVIEDRKLYEADLTIRSSTGEWSGTWDATHTSLRLLMVDPPNAV